MKGFHTGVAMELENEALNKYVIQRDNNRKRAKRKNEDAISAED